MEVLRFDWSRIVECFAEEFAHTFATSKKAHFDSVPPHLRVVDGARTRWSNLIFLDAVIYFLDFQEFNSASRRAFNQQQVLHECIIAELRRNNPRFMGEYFDEPVSSHHSNRDAEPGDTSSPGRRQLSSIPRTKSGGALLPPTDTVDIVLVGMMYPWTTAQELKNHILADPTSKSKGKFLSIADSLFTHPTLLRSGCNLQEALKTLLLKVVYDIPLLGINNPPSAAESGTVAADTSAINCLRSRPLRSTATSNHHHLHNTANTNTSSSNESTSEMSQQSYSPMHALSAVDTALLLGTTPSTSSCSDANAANAAALAVGEHMAWRDHSCVLEHAYPMDISFPRHRKSCGYEFALFHGTSSESSTTPSPRASSSSSSSSKCSCHSHSHCAATRVTPLAASSNPHHHSQQQQQQQCLQRHQDPHSCYCCCKHTTGNVHVSRPKHFFTNDDSLLAYEYSRGFDTTARSGTSSHVLTPSAASCPSFDRYYLRTAATTTTTTTSTSNVTGRVGAPVVSAAASAAAAAAIPVSSEEPCAKRPRIQQSHIPALTAVTANTPATATKEPSLSSSSSFSSMAASVRAAPAVDAHIDSDELLLMEHCDFHSDSLINSVGSGSEAKATMAMLRDGGRSVGKANENQNHSQNEHPAEDRASTASDFHFDPHAVFDSVDAEIVSSVFGRQLMRRHTTHSNGSYGSNSSHPQMVNRNSSSDSGAYSGHHTACRRSTSITTTDAPASINIDATGGIPTCLPGGDNFREDADEQGYNNRESTTVCRSEIKDADKEESDSDEGGEMRKEKDKLELAVHLLDDTQAWEFLDDVIWERANPTGKQSSSSSSSSARPVIEIPSASVSAGRSMTPVVSPVHAEASVAAVDAAVDVAVDAAATTGTAVPPPLLHLPSQVGLPFPDHNPLSRIHSFYSRRTTYSKPTNSSHKHPAGTCTDTSITATGMNAVNAVAHALLRHTATTSGSGNSSCGSAAQKSGDEDQVKMRLSPNAPTIAAPTIPATNSVMTATAAEATSRRARSPFPSFPPPPPPPSPEDLHRP